MNDFIFVANNTGTILFANNGGDVFDGFYENKILQTNLFDLFSEQSKLQIAKEIENAEKENRQTLKPISVELLIDHKLIPAVLKLELIYCSKNELSTISGCINCKSEAQPYSVQYYKQFYLGFIDNLPLGVYRTGANGTIHYVNNRLVEILGYENAEQLYKKSTTELFVEKELREEILEGWTDEKMQSIELQVYKKDGSTIWVKDSGRAIRDASGEILFLDGILEDISTKKSNEEKIKESESKLKELNASKDMLFSIISHDLRTPFNQFIGATELLLTKLDEYDKTMLRKFLLLLNEEATRSYRLLENLLQWSKNQRGLISFSPAPFYMHEFIKELLPIYQPMTHKNKIELLVDIPKKLYVYADKDMLSTIMRNLVSNALKFTPEEGSILISAEERIDEENMFSEYVEVSVSDTGIGIKKENIPTIFSFSNNKMDKSGYKESSTGLGLVLCKDFVEKHNGQIWVESEPGKGSTFYFTLK